MHTRWIKVLAVAALALTAITVVAVAGASSVTTQTSPVVGQGPMGAVVAGAEAMLQRSDNGLNVKLSMPTPQPGTYMYPGANAFLPAAVPGHPEAFSLWVFVFNYPNLCSGPCDVDDIGAATPARGGVYNAAGHIAGGPNLTFSGHVSAGAPQFSGSPLLEPRTAFVHLAVAPHGKVDPALLPDQITKPIGSLPFWWLAGFEID
jgi:hypothetical protein